MSERASRPDTTIPHMNSLAGVRILLLDDDADNLEFVAFMLRSRGAAVTTAESADEAMMLFLRATFDLLVSDIEMPVRDGYWLIDRIRSMPAGSGGMIPAVALTAHASEATREAVLGAGFSLRIAKPADPEFLVAELRALLATSQSPRLGREA